MNTTTQDTVSTAEPVEAGTLEHLDPNTLELEDNIRAERPLDADFLASVKANGVLTPVRAWRRDDGTVVVRFGTQRVRAARETRQATVPVYIVPRTQLGEHEAEAERLVQQIVENDQRAALTGAERAAAYQQLAFEGLSVPTIARRVGVKQARVKDGIAVAESAVAAQAATEHALTLDQAAVLVEFEDDPDAVEALVRTASENPAQFAHTAQRRRDDRAARQAVNATQDELRGRGYEILDTDPAW